MERFLLPVVVFLPYMVTSEPNDQIDSTAYLTNPNQLNRAINETAYFDYSNFSRYASTKSVDSVDGGQFCSASLFRCLLLSLVFGVLIISTVVGNAFVIAAVVLERNLQGVANYLIVSLAVADLTVAIMVNPTSFPSHSQTRLI